MSKKNPTPNNPLKFIKEEAGHLLADGQFGAVLARAGEGKTSFLMHLALDNLLREKNVLHICLDQPIKKVCLWYEEAFHSMSDQYETSSSDMTLETIIPRRFIMTFNIEDFSAKRLEERITDLTEQGIFFPQIVLLDGLPFDKTDAASLSELKTLAREHNFPVWFTAMTHREDNIAQNGDIPPPINHVSDLFEVVVKLKSAGREINVQMIKGP